MTENRARSRAEIVRMRRRDQAQRRVTESSTLATRPLPPITSRASMTYTVPQKATPPSSPRRYQTALSMPGFEIRLPTIRVTSVGIKSRLLSGFLSLLLGSALYLAWTLPEFHAAAARVNGNARLSADEINAVLSVTGQPIFTLMPADMETRLRLNYPELVSAQVILSLPNTVTVNIVERKPLILWQQVSGYTWIDGTGVAFRPRGNADGLILVTALGPNTTPPPGLPSEKDPLSPIPYISADLVKAIQTLAPGVPPGTTLVYDAQYGLGWSDSRGWQAYFGSSAKDMTLKLQVYQSLVTKLTQQGISPAFISVQYANAPYYRMSQ
jgi:hypothetical protein